MKKLLLLLFISLTLQAESFKISIHDLAQRVSESNHINVIVDSEIKINTNFYFYSDLDSKISLNAFKVIIQNNGYQLQSLGMIFYLTKAKQKKQKFSTLKFKNIPYENLLKISSFYNVNLIKVSTNQVIVRYKEIEDFHNFKKFLKSVSSVKHVKLEGEIIYVNETNLKDIGIDFASIASSINSVGSFDIGLFSNINNNQAIQQTIASRGINTLGDISLFISLLKETGEAHVVTRPNMLIMDNEKSTFTSGQRIRLVTSATDSVRNSGEYSSKQYEFLDVGLTLDCSANILEGHAILDFKFEVSEIEEYKPLLDVLIIANKTYRSKFDIKSGEQILLAGLTTSVNESYNSSPYIIGDIPWFGELFKHETKKKQNISYLIYFKATIK